MLLHICNALIVPQLISGRQAHVLRVAVHVEQIVHVRASAEYTEGAVFIRASILALMLQARHQVASQ